MSFVTKNVTMKQTYAQVSATAGRYRRFRKESVKRIPQLTKKTTGVMKERGRQEPKAFKEELQSCRSAKDEHYNVFHNGHVIAQQIKQNMGHLTLFDNYKRPRKLEKFNHLLSRNDPVY